MVDRAPVSPPLVDFLSNALPLKFLLVLISTCCQSPVHEPPPLSPGTLGSLTSRESAPSPPRMVGRRLLAVSPLCAMQPSSLFPRRFPHQSSPPKISQSYRLNSHRMETSQDQATCQLAIPPLNLVLADLFFTLSGTVLKDCKNTHFRPCRVLTGGLKRVTSQSPHLSVGLRLSDTFCLSHRPWTPPRLLLSIKTPESFPLCLLQRLEVSLRFEWIGWNDAAVPVLLRGWSQVLLGPLSPCARRCVLRFKLDQSS